MMWHLCASSLVLAWRMGNPSTPVEALADLDMPKIAMNVMKTATAIFAVVRVKLRMRSLSSLVDVHGPPRGVGQPGSCRTAQSAAQRRHAGERIACRWQFAGNAGA